MKLTICIAAACLCMLPGLAAAQSTLADPVPLQGNQAESLAGTAAVNSTLKPGNAAAPSPAELDRRRAHGAQAAACRQAARDQFKGKRAAREEARLKCEATFKAQKATWYDKSQQLK
ncbi:MAG: hypothetical protein Q7T87_07270 [Polaromonas sp.]|nr:hypothetical protein [Polaromonas sp.]